MNAPRLAAAFSDGGRFLAAGAANTLLTLAAYQLFLFAVSPPVAYALSWACGIAFVVAVYPTRVFPGGRTGRLDRLALAAVYGGVFLLGLILLDLLTRAGLPPRGSIVLVMATTTAATFLGSRLLLRRA